MDGGGGAVYRVCEIWRKGNKDDNRYKLPYFLDNLQINYGTKKAERKKYHDHHATLFRRLNLHPAEAARESVSDPRAAAVGAAREKHPGKVFWVKLKVSFSLGVHGDRGRQEKRRPGMETNGNSNLIQRSCSGGSPALVLVLEQAGRASWVSGRRREIYYEFRYCNFMEILLETNDTVSRKLLHATKQLAAKNC